MPKVVIFIVTFNNESDLPGLLSSLNNLDYTNCEIFFCDNASTDKSVSIIESFGYQVIKNKENLWFAGGNNQLQAKTKDSEYIFLLNPDTEIDPLCIKSMVRLMEEDKNIAISQPLIMRLPETDAINTKGNNLHFAGFGYVGGDGERQYPTEVTEIGYASGAALFLRSSALDGRLFREHFKAYHEDLDLSWRIKLKGYKIVLCPEARVYHRYTFKKGGYKWYLMELNRKKVLLTNYSATSLFLLLPYLMFVEGVVILRSILEGWVTLKLRSYVSFLFAIPMLLRERALIQRTRLVSDRVIIASMTGSLVFPSESLTIKLKVFNQISEAYFRAFKQALSLLSPKFVPQRTSKELET